MWEGLGNQLKCNRLIFGVIGNRWQSIVIHLHSPIFCVPIQSYSNHNHFENESIFMIDSIIISFISEKHERLR